MRNYLLLILLVIIGCGYIHKEFKGDPGDVGQSSVSCTVTKNDGIATITCPDGSTTTVRDGDRGNAGSSGVVGPQGHSNVFNVVSATNTECFAGGSVILMGLDVNDNLILDANDTNFQSVVVCNGRDGQSAPPTQFTPVGLVDPCGAKPEYYNEVFLRLADGTLLASFSDNVSGLNTRFSVLIAGSYMTSDGTNCLFSIDSHGNIYNEHY